MSSDATNRTAMALPADLAFFNERRWVHRCDGTGTFESIAALPGRSNL